MKISQTFSGRINYPNSGGDIILVTATLIPRVILPPSLNPQNPLRGWLKGYIASALHKDPKGRRRVGAIGQRMMSGTGFAEKSRYVHLCVRIAR